MNTRETRGHGMKLLKWQTSKLNLRKFSFSHGVVGDCHYLPRQVGRLVESRDVEQSKTEMDTAWKTSGFTHYPIGA